MSEAAFSNLAAPADLSPAEPITESAPERWSRRFGWIAIVVCVLVAYANSFNVPLVFDGANYLLNPPDPLPIRDISGPRKILELLDHGQTRALSYLTFGIDYALYGYDVRGWHVTSVLVQICAALALYGIARHGFRSPRAEPYFLGATERTALAVALLWGVHPLNTQSVTYLYQRQEALTGMFYFLTIYTMTRLADTGRLRWAVASLAASTAGMASKEVMITAPLVVLWYDRVFCAASWRELFARRGWYYCGLACTWGMLVWLMSRTWNVYASAGILDSDRVTPMEYALTQPGVIVRYLRLSLVPYGLNLDYAWPKAVTWPFTDDDGRIAWFPTSIDAPWALVRSLAVVGGLLVLTLIAVFRSPALGFLGDAFFVALAPTSSVAPIVDLCFEHRMYVSLAPVMALVVVGARSAWRAIAPRIGLSEVVAAAALETSAWLAVATFVALTLVRNHDYRSEAVLWGDAATKAPRNPRAQYNYGVYLQIEGDFDRAIEQYHRCLENDPNYTDAYLNLARLAAHQNRARDAYENYEKLLETPPLQGYTQHLEALYKLAEMSLRNDDPGRARYYADQIPYYTEDVSPEGLQTKADAEKLRQKIDAEIARQRDGPFGPQPSASPSDSVPSVKASPTPTR